MAACYLYKSISKSLTDKNDEEQAVSQLKSPIDAVAIGIHAWALHSGLTFEGLTESEDTKSSGNIGSSKSSNNSFTLDDLKPLDPKWQAGSPNYFFFRYSKNNLPLDITITKLGASTALVSASYGGKDAIAKLDTNKYISNSFFQRPDGSEETRDAYMSDSMVESLCQTLNTEVLHNLIPHDSKLDKGRSQKEEDQPQNPSAASSMLQEPMDDNYSRASTPRQPSSRPFTPNLPPAATATSSREQYPSRDPMMPPGFEDEYEMQGDMRPRPGIARPPFGPSIGDSDLYPPGIGGPNPPMQPHIGPGMDNPQRRRGGGDGSGGMNPSLDDPYFTQGNNDVDPDMPNSMMRPPGGRWDPPGPGGGSRPGRGFGGSGSGNGGGPGGFGGFGFV